MLTENENNEPIEKKEISKDVNSDLNNLKEFGTLNIPKPNEEIYVLPIIGQIEGHMAVPPQNKSTKYEHVIPQLVNIEMNDTVKGVLFDLIIVGGVVEEVLAISEMIISLSKLTVSLVLEGVLSIRSKEH